MTHELGKPRVEPTLEELNGVVNDVLTQENITEALRYEKMTHYPAYLTHLKNTKIAALELAERMQWQPIETAVSVMRSTQRQTMDTAPTDGTMVLLDFGDMDYHGPHIALGWHSARAWRSYEIVTGHPIGWWPLSVLGKDEA